MQHDFDPIVLVPIRSVLRPGDIFVDIGANLGWYSFHAAPLVGPEGRVHAFEIDHRPLQCLTRTIAFNPDLPITLHRLAIGDANGEVAFVEEKESGHSRLAPDNRGRRVPMRSLDALFATREMARFKALKIDVEGAELRVLRGARRLLEQHRPLVVCELVEANLRVLGGSPAEVVAFLKDLGYQVADLPGAWTATIVARHDGQP